MQTKEWDTKSMVYFNVLVRDDYLACSWLENVDNFIILNWFQLY